MSDVSGTRGMARSSRTLAGVLLVLLPTVAFGGTSLLTALVADPAYAENELRRELWRAGHAHAGVLLVLALVALRYVDEAALGSRAKALARHAIPLAAILLPAAFFLSVASPEATEPNPLINLAYLGAVSLVAGTLTLGVGLLRREPPTNGEQSIAEQAGHRPAEFDPGVSESRGGGQRLLDADPHEVDLGPEDERGR